MVRPSQYQHSPTAAATPQPFNRLVHAVSRDTAFLVDVHREVVAVDPFTANLVKILQDVRPRGPHDPSRPL